MYTKLWSKQLLQIQPLQYIFPSEEALAVPLAEGDTVLVNDGMGRNQYDFIGFPSDTSEVGAFTVETTIAKIEERDGVTFYRAKVKWPRSRVSFVFPDAGTGASLSYYGNGDRVNIPVVTNVDEAEIETDAGLTESNSVYRGNYVLAPIVQHLPDCSYKLEIGGQLLQTSELPKVFNGTEVASFIQKKDGRFRYINICPIKDLKGLLARSFTINILPNDATIAYTLTTNQGEFTQSGGTVYAYAGEELSYRITRQGYKTIEDTFSFTWAAVNTTLDIAMQEMHVYTNVYPNGSFATGQFVLLNGGVGENTQEWTANPTSDLAYNGPFTQQGEVVAIDPVTGYLTVQGDPLVQPEVLVGTMQDDAEMTVYGQAQTVNVSVVANPDNAEISSSAGLETVTSAIREYHYCEFDALSGYTMVLDAGGLRLSTGQQYLVHKNDAVSYALVYNNKIVDYKVFANKNVIRKVHAVTVIPNVQGATVKLYGVTANSIQAYSGQTIDYEVSASGYATVSGTYTVPMNDTAANNYSVNVTLQPDN